MFEVSLRVYSKCFEFRASYLCLVLRAYSLYCTRLPCVVRFRVSNVSELMQYDVVLTLEYHSARMKI